MLQGSLHPDFAAVGVSLARIVPRRGAGGAAVCVYHRGEKVVDIWGGTRDAAGNPWEADTLSLSFSTTKGVASTLLHVFADRGLIDYDARVADYWPEFARDGKDAIAVRHLLCHEAGLYAIADVVEHASEMLDWDQMVRRLAAATPRHPAGAAHGYHALTYGWLVGELVRRVAGMKPISELFATELAAPLGLDGLYCGVPADQQRRCAQLFGRQFSGPVERRRANTERMIARAQRWRRRLSAVGVGFDPTEALAALVAPGMEELDYDGEAWRSASVPAANGMFTARSLARLYACLAAGGELDGVRLLSAETVRRASTQQNRGVGRVIPLSMRWRLGYHRAFVLGARAPTGFGHFGFGGSGAFADPARQLAVALTVNSGVGTPLGDLRIARIGGVAVRCADRRVQDLLPARTST
ncbi:MAG TPA: serine hydrolase domain-containing protein [Myxococcota bacterium]|nr:serine hydrolase domain-containing protein [Myxococcota bacterium]